MERRIMKLNWRKIGEMNKDIDKVILPVGTLEAHSITSNGTDIQIPEHIADKIADKIDSMILPAVPYGITTSLLPYPGSINIDEEVFTEYVYEIARSASKEFYKYFIIINGHGGNNNALSSLKKRIYEDTGMFVIIIHWWSFAYEICKKIYGSEGGHGGVDETSMMLIIDENSVFPEFLNDKNLYYKMEEGIESLPAPATAVLYSEKGGKINLDRKLAEKYHNNVINALSKSILKIIENIDGNLPV